jgi:cell division protein FtsI (penicillin-binding protein 3)
MTGKKRAKTKKPTTKKKDAARRLPVWRFYFVAVMLLSVTSVAVWRIANHQVLAGEKGYEFLQAEGEARALRNEDITALRGLISDRNGEPLAVSTPVTTLWANPKYLPDDRNWGDLARLLDVPIDELEDRIEKYRNKQFMYLKRHMPPSEAEGVMALDIPGIYARREYKRFYPAGEVASHVVGFTNIDDNGQEGIELAYQEWLQGVSGEKQVLKDRKGRIIKDVQLLKPAEPGKNLQLSLDLRIQYLAYRELKKTIQRFKAKSGSVVVVDTKTGEVLAMVNQPSYNPNNRSQLKSDSLRNRALTDVFEPGSTVKPFTMAAALESGQYTPQSVIDTSPGRIKVGNKTLLDPVNYGSIDLTKIITKSSQVGTTKVALSLEAEEIRSLFYRVGIGQATGSGFPGESVGQLPLRRKWSPIEQANFSFGYGLSVTALQLAQAYSVIANDGVNKQLSLLRVTDQPHSEKVMTEKIARQVLEMMATVTEQGGTGTNAQIPAYRVAGKTGTVHKIESGAYSEDSYMALFAGIAPVDSPRFVTVVVVDQPTTGKYYGGEVAAPVFSEIVSALLRLYSVPPTNRKDMRFS